ncbi:outer membrane protein assembly factor BamB family protein [Thalassotalea marina]|uniref:Pyrrolo-quinoline quinone repeat domain-containing protein n=1 Tax=Thalassotalea marina TaxID=1673741 RepID=A0A919BMY5_9GAMM|nr:PQQ-binding-like beta-propeller repeat protein [Thalassotalea marina]GHG00183.1 hypothetical protein GCM10017161_31020 [Thalassotalea marina]
MENLYVGIKGHVVCIEKSSGNEIWRTKLKSADLTNVYYEDNNVYAYAYGHLFCLSAANGEIIWENDLKGLGYGACIIAGQQNVTTMSDQNNAASAASVAAIVAATSVTVAGDGGS